MLIISTFEHSTEVEEALAVLEQIGIPRQRIMLVVMDSPGSFSGSNITEPAGSTTLAFEVGMASGTAASVFGISYGFRLTMGPIIWGIIAALAGFIVGFCLTLRIQSMTSPPRTRKKGRQPELTVIVQCSDERLHEVRQVLWKYRALSVGQIHEPQP